MLGSRQGHRGSDLRGSPDLWVPRFGDNGCSNISGAPDDYELFLAYFSKNVKIHVKYDPALSFKILARLSGEFRQILANFLDIVEKLS